MFLIIKTLLRLNSFVFLMSSELYEHFCECYHNPREWEETLAFYLGQFWVTLMNIHIKSFLRINPIFHIFVDDQRRNNGRTDNIINFLNIYVQLGSK